MQRLKTVLQSKYFIIFSIIFLIIYLILTTKVIKYNSLYSDDTSFIEGIVTSYKYDGNKLSLTIKGKENIVATYYFKTEKNLLDIKNNLKLGSLVSIKGVLARPINNTIPNTFNYKKYLYNKHIYYTMNISNIKINNDNIPLLYKIKNSFINRLEKFSSNAYLYAFVLGDKSYIDSNTYEDFRNNGVTHLFAVSGMHVSFLVLALEFLLKKFKVNNSIINFIIISFLIFYMFLIGFTASVVRASLLYILLLFNKLLNLNLKSIIVLYILFIILLSFNPFYIYDIGVLYSFVSTVGLMVFSKKINGNYFLKLLKVSFIAFIFSLPITLLNFYEFNLTSILNNIVMVPFVSLILFPLSIITFLLPLIEPLLNICINILEHLNAFLNIFSINIVVGKINVIFIIIYYLIIYYIYKYNFKISLFLIILICIFKFLPFLDKNSYIYFIDVGQGDSSLVITENRKDIILVDTGGKTDFKKESWMIQNNTAGLENNIISFFHSLGIDSIDLLIITHGDMDHIGYAHEIIKKIKVKNLMLNNNSYNTKELELMSNLNLIKNNYKGYNINICNLNKTIDKNENVSSLVLNMNLKNANLLIMGDAPKEVEKNILKEYKLNIGILKLGHHGSKTSSDYNFLKEINPSYSIISSGRGNRYNHPAKETIDSLNKLHLKYYNTKDLGTISFKFNKKEIKNKFYLP